MTSTASPPALPPDHPLATVSALPYGIPDFAAVTPDALREAIDAGFAEARAEVDAVAARDDDPTFASTVLALEDSGQLLDRALSLLDNLCLSDSSAELLALRSEVAPRRARHRDRMLLDPRLWERLSGVPEDGLDPVQRRVLERYRTDLRRAGAGLPEDVQQRLRELNEELAGLQSSYAERVLAGRTAAAIQVTDEEELAGLSRDTVATARRAAEDRGRPGWLFPLLSTTGQPLLAEAEDRGLRERVHRASVDRGRGGEYDTRPLLTRIAHLRAIRADLLGFADHASYVAADQTAGSAEAVRSLLERVAGPAARNARAEQLELEQLMSADSVLEMLQPWDWQFYAERLRSGRFSLDEQAMRAYFQVDRVLEEGVFAAASALYGVRFVRRDDIPAHHPDARVYEVLDGDDTALGLFVADWFARDSKSGGAWMSHFVRQYGDVRPVVVVNLNVPPPGPGEPALMTTDEVTTAFHEFGHALHGLFSRVAYRRVSGTQVPRDFVEFPSQVNEMWAWWPEILQRYAVHHRTGEPLPSDAAQRLREARAAGEGFRTVEYLAAAVIDQAWHRLDPDQEVDPDDVDAFEGRALAAYGLDLEAVPPRYHSTYLSHSFSGGYDAGYYSYLWSEVLDADLVEWFTENGGLRRDNGDRFRDRLLSRGNSADPLVMYREVRGRDAAVEPLLSRRGLT